MSRTEQMRSVLVILLAFAVVELSVIYIAHQDAKDAKRSGQQLAAAVNEQSQQRSAQKLQELQLTCERANFTRGLFLRDDLALRDRRRYERDSRLAPLLDCYRTAWLADGATVPMDPRNAAIYLRALQRERQPVVVQDDARGELVR